MAGFAYAPSLPEDVDRRDDWQFFEQPFNILFGFGTQVDEIAVLMERGEYGVEGLCRWLESVVREFGVDAGLLEGKLERIMTALLIR